MSDHTPKRRLPVRPDLNQLRHQAKDLLREMRLSNPQTKLAEAQLALARSYDAPSWPRLALACRLIDAIWLDDIDTVRQIVVKHPKLLHESALIRERNWGPPMSYAANLGRDEIIRMLHSLGAKDMEHALGRASLQGRIETARMLHKMLGSQRPPKDCLSGPAYTLSASGTALMLELGAQVRDEHGKPIAPVAVVIESDSRKPVEKHQILEMYVKYGIELADTPVMALHRGRIDLLAEHLRRDPNLLTRKFSHEEIYPPEWGCRAEVDTEGTPLAGATLLHLCVDYGEIEIARWLLDRGMAVDAKAALDADGFGGHTALFSAVVCYANFWPNYRGEPDEAPFARLLLDHGANPNARASLKKLHLHDDKRYWQECRDVTPVEWGQQYQHRILVSEAAMRMIEKR